jgi:preprotein translocase subunit SecA
MKEQEQRLSYTSSENAPVPATAGGVPASPRQGGAGATTREDGTTIRQIATGGTYTKSDDEFANVGRNDPCPCGSGQKYKRCHGA